MREKEKSERGRKENRSKENRSKEKGRKEKTKLQEKRSKGNARKIQRYVFIRGKKEKDCSFALEEE